MQRREFLVHRPRRVVPHLRQLIDPGLNVALVHPGRVEVGLVHAQKGAELPEVIPVGPHRPRRVLPLHCNIVQKSLNHAAKLLQIFGICKDLTVKIKCI